MSFGENMQKLRKKNGMSQEELAEKIVVTRQTISKWELDQSTPDLEYIVQLSELFGVSTDFLIKGVEPVATQTYREPADCETTSCNYNRYVFKSIIGITMCSISVISIIALLIISAKAQHSLYLEGREFTGLIGWLFSYKAWYIFSLCCAGLLAGIAILTDEFLVSKLKSKYKKNFVIIYTMCIGLILLLINFVMIGFRFVIGITDIALAFIIISAIIAIVKHIFTLIHHGKSNDQI